MSSEIRFDHAAAEYTGDSFTRYERVKNNQRRRPPSRGRRGKAPVSVNGMHRRRRRKMTW